MLGYKYSTQIKVPSCKTHSDIVIDAVQSFCRLVNTTKEESDDISVATAEAFYNCCEWAYPETTGVVTIFLRVPKNENVLYVSIIDDGVAMKDVEQCRAAKYSTDPKYHAGMGFSVMESFMSGVVILSPRNSESMTGTSVQLRRVLNAPTT